MHFVIGSFPASSSICGSLKVVIHDFSLIFNNFFFAFLRTGFLRLSSHSVQYTIVVASDSSTREELTRHGSYKIFSEKAEEYLFEFIMSLRSTSERSS